MSSLRKLWEELDINPMVRELYFDHSLRVMYLSFQLGRQMDAPDVRNLRLATVLHDVGLVGISSKIILKRGALSDTEWAIVQTQCHAGNWICRQVLGNQLAAEAFRDHHEKWDGSGYRRGLRGEEINHHARIISVCNAFDSMVHKELPYREKQKTVDEAITELWRCAWSHFDGDVVDEFVSIIREREKIVASREQMKEEKTELLELAG